MTPKAADALARLSRLVTYPDDRYAEGLDALVASIEAWHPDAACDLATFAARIGRATGDRARSGAGRSGAPRAQRAWRGAGAFARLRPPWTKLEERSPGGPALTSNDLQELFTRTFDLNPVCALEVGWHLFGEEYERGAFLVRMRQALREHGIAEGGELPDHLASMLLLVTKLDADDSDVLVANALVPAVVKMLEPLEKSESPFLPLVKAIREVLAACAPAGAEVD